MHSLERQVTSLSGKKFRYLTNIENIGLAPMEGVSDFPTRLWFSQTSAPAFMGTPFLRVTETFPKKIRLSFAPELTSPYDQVSYQIIPQIMTSSSDFFVRVGEQFLKRSPIIDLNCGCPSPRCLRGGAGSSLLLDPEALRKFGEYSLQRLGSERVSIKMRLGFHSEAEFPRLISLLSELPLHHLTIHGRTRLQKYQGLANWKVMKEAASQLTFPIVGSGDITDVQSMEDRMGPEVSKAFIGRGALRNPWIFEEIRQNKRLTVTSLTLKYSLACFSLLNFLFTQKQQALLNLVASGLFLEPALNDEQKWHTLFTKLAAAMDAPRVNPEDLGDDRANLSRTKMLWTYMHQQHGHSHQIKGMLRSKNYRDFFVPHFCS